MVGQFLRTTPAERKTLLSAGAAAGMSATFGSPVSAVLLAIELLLFEFRPRSLIPVALASATAAGMRIILEGTKADFAMPNISEPVGVVLVVYILLGAIMGVAAAGVTRGVYAVEDTFERLPIHWMWWPSIGAVAVGVIGWFAPRTLGVGYNNITDMLSDRLAIQTVLVLCSLKFLSWVIALGSGTSGGTLAPLFTIGGGLVRSWGQAWTGCSPRSASTFALRRLSEWRPSLPGPPALCWRRWSLCSRLRCNRWACCRFWAVARHRTSCRAC